MITPQNTLYAGAGASLVLAIVAGLLESRRNRRRDVDAAGWVPWRGLQVLAFFAALAFFIFALHA